MSLYSTRFLIGLILFTLFQVAVVLEFQLENEMPAPVYNTTDFETDLQYPKRHQEKLIETQLNELENNTEDVKITNNLRDQHGHNNLEYNTYFLSERAVEVYTEKEKGYILRKKRSAANNSTALDKQFEQFCSSVGSQPCTCYYPDHKNIPQFELGIDELTKNASGLNGTGPGNCQDLKVLGNKLEGLYLVRFNSKRIKTIYCNFNNETIQDTKNQDQNKKDTHPKEGSIGRSSKTIIRFCGDVKGKRCTYLYSDYPDAPQMGNVNLVRKEPTSCKDLSLMGHILQGFYMVRLNTIKVKIIYCDFKNQTTVGNNKGANTECISSSNNKSQLLYCNGLGSQPCSCYYSNSPNISQFELSNDETTRKALLDNGPTSCEDLKIIGYTIKGFYMVRFNVKILKTVFCEFHEPSIKKDNPYSNTTTMMSSSSKTTQIEVKTTPIKITTRKYMKELSTKIATLKPQIRQQNYVKNPGSIEQFSKTTPIIKNYGTFYLLKNKRNKCMSCGFLNLRFPYEDNCDPKDKYQHWRWCSDNQLCNHLGKFLSKEYLGLDRYPNGTTEKGFHIKLLESSSSKDVVQKWSATGLGQLVDIEDGLCLGVSYNSVDRQNLLIGVQSCDETDDAQFWFFENIWTPTSVSASRPQVVGFTFPGKSTSYPAFEASEIIPLIRKDGKSYLLKNKRNKCMSCGLLNRYGPYEDNCDLKDNYQHWKWCEDNKLCNHMGQFLSKNYIGDVTERNGKTEKLFHIKISSLSKDLVQNWRATDLGQLVDIKDGLCLGVAYNSVDRLHLLIEVKSCDEKDDGQFWSFESITFSTSEAMILHRSIKIGPLPIRAKY